MQPEQKMARINCVYNKCVNNKNNYEKILSIDDQCSFALVESFSHTSDVLSKQIKMHAYSITSIVRLMHSIIQNL